MVEFSIGGIVHAWNFPLVELLTGVIFRRWNFPRVEFSRLKNFPKWNFVKWNLPGTDLIMQSPPSVVIKSQGYGALRWQMWATEEKK